MGSTEFMFNIQRTLSIAQAVPVVGFIFVSPAKAIVSVAQITAGVALLVLFGSLTLASAFLNIHPVTKWCFAMTGTGGLHLINGLGSCSYANANFLTLGLLGLAVESYLYRLKHPLATDVPTFA